jgi:hypothetical protein
VKAANGIARERQSCQSGGGHEQGAGRQRACHDDQYAGNGETRYFDAAEFAGRTLGLSSTPVPGPTR